MADYEFKRNIAILQSNKIILVTNNMISVNGTFQSNRRKLKLRVDQKQLPAKKENQSNEDQDQEQLLKEREYVVDACLVRIMKGRRICGINDLITDSCKLITNFKPDIQLIKRRIDSLIEREYMKRDPQDKTQFTYVP